MNKAKPRSYHQYTTGELKLIKKMAIGGANRQDIADEVELDRMSVCHVISANKWKRAEYNYTPMQLGRIMMSVKNKQLSLELNKTAKQISQKRYELRLKLRG